MLSMCNEIWDNEENNLIVRKYCIPCKEWRHANEWQYPYFPLKTIRFRKKFSEQCKEHITIAKNCWIRSRGGEGQIFVGGD